MRSPSFCIDSKTWPDFGVQQSHRKFSVKTFHSGAMNPEILRAAKDSRIVGVEPGSDAGRRHRGEKRFVIANGIRAKGLADVGIQVDAHPPTSLP
jgi:hypothetical protein